MSNPLLEKGKAAFRQRAWAEAYAQLSAADRDTVLEPLDLEQLATAAYLSGHDEASCDVWTRAHHEYLRIGEPARAARCVFWLSLELFERRDWAQANGWIARGMRLLDEAQADGAERGLLLVLAVRNCMKLGDVDGARAAAERAVELAQQTNDPELNIFSRLALAQLKTHAGQTRDALALFDEIMVGITVDAVSPIGVGVVYCAVIEGCYYSYDIPRAREWTTALSRWCATQPGLVPFRGKCLVRRAEIMRFSGEWSAALAEAEHACRWSHDHAAVSQNPLGAAWYQQGEIHRLRGELAESESAYLEASEHGFSPEPGLALLRLLQGQKSAAESAIRRLLAETQSGFVRAGVLAPAVEVLLAVGDRAAARAAAEDLGQLAHQHDALVLRAQAAQANATVLLAEGDAQAALPALREAWTAWQDLDAPYEAARVRVLLALVCRELGDHASAQLELDAAYRVFERLSAVPDLLRVDELRGAPQKSGPHTLTARELQVLERIARGQTNRAIANELFISERTVDRHVSNILSKLALPTRSAATAYAFQHGLV